jgi:hypothetical protein
MVSRYSAATLGGSRLQSPGAQFEEAGQDLVPLGFDGLVWQTKLAIALTEQGPSGIGLAVIDIVAPVSIRHLFKARDRARKRVRSDPG